MEYKTGLCLNTIELLGFHTHYCTYALEAVTPFSQSSTLSYEKLHFLTVKIITIWFKFLLILDRVF